MEEEFENHDSNELGSRRKIWERFGGRNCVIVVWLVGFSEVFFDIVEPTLLVEETGSEDEHVLFVPISKLSKIITNDQKWMLESNQLFSESLVGKEMCIFYTLYCIAYRTGWHVRRSPELET